MVPCRFRLPLTLVPTFDFDFNLVSSATFANMEPLTALGVAANVAQFLGYGINLIATTKEIYMSSSGSTNEVETMETIYGRLGQLGSYLQLPSQLPPSTDKYDAVIEQAIRDIARDCQNDCDRLLEVTNQLKRGNGHRSCHRSFRAALKSTWKSSEIDVLEKRLQRAQQTLTLHVCSLTWWVYSFLYTVLSLRC